MSYIYANLSGGSCGWLRMRGWLWLRLLLCMWLWLGRLRYWYTNSLIQSVDHTLIVAVHPPHLPHLGLQRCNASNAPLIPIPQMLYLGLQRCSASICGVASSTRALDVRGRIYIRRKAPVPNT